MPARRRGRQWGWVAQLYAARSAESWGIGDLADLRRLAAWAAGQQADLLMLNPLGAVAPGHSAGRQPLLSQQPAVPQSASISAWKKCRAPSGWAAAGRVGGRGPGLCRPIDTSTATRSSA